MKRKFTLFLLFSVLLIWGFIIYRLLMVEEPLQVPPEKMAAQSPVVNKEQIQHELIADYRDPFFEASIHQPLESGATSTAFETSEPFELPVAEPMEQVPICHYKGSIKNHSSKKTITLVEFEGKDIMMEEGESRNGITLIKNHGEYITVRLVDGTTQSIYK